MTPTWRICLHRDETGLYDCGIGFLAAGPRKLCDRHPKVRIAESGSYELVEPAKEEALCSS